MWIACIGFIFNLHFSEALDHGTLCLVPSHHPSVQRKHRLDDDFQHSVISGQICPYCDSKWGWKKVDRLDEHVAKFHVLEMQSPVQTW